MRKHPRPARVCLALCLIAGLSFGLVFQAATSRASATTTGYAYAVGLVTSSGKSFTMFHIRSATVQADEAAVDKTLTSDQLAAATTALGAAPTEGFTFTKIFDLTDRSLFMAGLAETTVDNAGLFVYVNGTLVDHLRAQPAYVAYVNQTAPPAGSKAAVVDKIEFVATGLSRVGTATVPVSTTSKASGASYEGTLTTSDGVTHPLGEITQISAVTEPADFLFNDPKVTNTIQQDISYSTSNPPVAVVVKKYWGSTDNSVSMVGLSLKKQQQLQVTFFNNGTPYLQYTMSNVVISKVDISDPKPGTTTPVIVTMTFIATKADVKYTPLS